MRRLSAWSGGIVVVATWAATFALLSIHISVFGAELYPGAPHLVVEEAYRRATYAAVEAALPIVSWLIFAAMVAGPIALQRPSGRRARRRSDMGEGLSDRPGFRRPIMFLAVLVLLLLTTAGVLGLMHIGPAAGWHRAWSSIWHAGPWGTVLGVPASLIFAAMRNPFAAVVGLAVGAVLIARVIRWHRLRATHAESAAPSRVGRARYRREMQLLAVLTPLLLAISFYLGLFAFGGNSRWSGVWLGIDWGVLADVRAMASIFAVFNLFGPILLLTFLAVRHCGPRARALSGMMGRGWRGWIRHLVFWVVLVAIPVPLLLVGSIAMGGVPLIPALVFGGLLLAENGRSANSVLRRPRSASDRSLRRLAVLAAASLALNIALVAKVVVFDPNYPLKVIWFDPAGFKGSWETREIPEDLRHHLAASWGGLRIGEDRTLYISRWEWFTDYEMLWNSFSKTICGVGKPRQPHFDVDYPCWWQNQENWDRLTALEFAEAMPAPGERISIDGWVGGPYEAPESHFCAIGAKYKSGVTLIFVLQRGDRFSVELRNDEWAFPAGAEFNAAYSIGKGSSIPVTATAPTSTSLAFAVAGGAAALTSFRTLEVLKFRAKDLRLDFNLSNGQAIPMLTECMYRDLNGAT